MLVCPLWTPNGAPLGLIAMDLLRPAALPSSAAARLATTGARIADRLISLC
jgi:hypothetical protein